MKSTPTRQRPWNDHVAHRPRNDSQENPNTIVMSHDPCRVIIRRLQIRKREIAGARKGNSRLMLGMAVQIMVTVVALMFEPQGVI